MGEMSTVLPSELVGEDSVNEVACCRDSKSNGVVTVSVGLDEPSEGKVLRLSLVSKGNTMTK
jgi:hypothetical protein